MHRLRFTPSAIASMENIGEYTQTNWGIKQRDHYLNLLDQCFNDIAANPMRGKDCSDIAPHLRRYPKEKHVIFYRIEDNCVTIIDVLHEKMDPELHIF